MNVSKELLVSSEEKLDLRSFSQKGQNRFRNDSLIEKNNKNVCLNKIINKIIDFIEKLWGKMIEFFFSNQNEKKDARHFVINPSDDLINDLRFICILNKIVKDKEKTSQKLYISINELKQALLHLEEREKKELRCHCHQRAKSLSRKNFTLFDFLKISDKSLKKTTKIFEALEVDFSEKFKKKFKHRNFNILTSFMGQKMKKNEIEYPEWEELCKNYWAKRKRNLFIQKFVNQCVEMTHAMINEEELKKFFNFFKSKIETHCKKISNFLNKDWSAAYNDLLTNLNYQNQFQSALLKIECNLSAFSNCHQICIDFAKKLSKKIDIIQSKVECIETLFKPLLPNFVDDLQETEKENEEQIGEIKGLYKVIQYKFISFIEKNEEEIEKMQRYADLIKEFMKKPDASDIKNHLIQINLKLIEPKFSGIIKAIEKDSEIYISFNEGLEKIFIDQFCKQLCLLIKKIGKENDSKKLNYCLNMLESILDNYSKIIIDLIEKDNKKPQQEYWAKRISDHAKKENKKSKDVVKETLLEKLNNTETFKNALNDCKEQLQIFTNTNQTIELLTKDLIERMTNLLIQDATNLSTQSKILKELLILFDGTLMKEGQKKVNQVLDQLDYIYNSFLSEKNKVLNIKPISNRIDIHLSNSIIVNLYKKELKKIIKCLNDKDRRYYKSLIKQYSKNKKIKKWTKFLNINYLKEKLIAHQKKLHLV